MAIKAGQILHDAEGYVIDRIQSAGVGSLNIPEEKIKEVGNFQTVATVRDTPDLSFDLESFDVSAEFEALLVGKDPTALTAGEEIDFGDVQPLDITSPFKSGNNAYNIIKGIVIPYLNLERCQYRFGVGQNSTQSFTLRGDSVYYVPGVPAYEEFAHIGATTYSFGQVPAILYQESGDNYYALSVSLKDSTTGEYKRLFIGDDYTNTATGFTLLADLSATYDTICVTYGHGDATNYTQTGNTPLGQPVHQTASVKPAAVRGKDIDVYLGDSSATPTFTRWTGIQSIEVSRSVNLENDEELGNSKFVASDYDTAEVTGSITMKPESPTDLWDKIAQVADVPTNEIVGPFTSAFFPLEIRISDPDDGSVLKTLYVPDARFTIPAVQGRVDTKLEVNFDFSSDGGSLLVYNGSRS